MKDIDDKVRALGTAFTPEQITGSMALFSPLLERYSEADVIRDIAYGPDARNRLDLFGSSADGGGRPVVVFIHGGGFIRGDKGGAGTPYYNNVGAWARAEGWLGVTGTYRLAPDHMWPSGAEDVAAIVRWLRENALAHGGDRDKIIVFGQSAGAAHVASYIGCDGFADVAESSIAGAIFMSGVYDLVNAAHSPYEVAYYGSDSIKYAEQSSVEGLARTTLPCLFAVSENDPEAFQRQAAFAVERWVLQKGKWPRFVQFEAQNHISTVHQIGSTADRVGPVLARFVTEVCARRSSTPSLAR
ncbi:MAG: alpha/beta hydrolase [Janthinobacterium lividum]